MRLMKKALSTAAALALSAAADALGQYDAGDYAYWQASGISSECDETMIDNCIELFCTENLAG